MVASVDPAARRVAVEFPGTGEKRLYALGTAVLRRVLFRPGETVADRAGRRLVITAVEETDCLATYVGADRRLREDEIADATSVSRPHERLLAGEADETGTFDLRRRALPVNLSTEADVRAVDFPHDDVLGWVQAHRLELVGELVGIRGAAFLAPLFAVIGALCLYLTPARRLARLVEPVEPVEAPAQAPADNA